MLFGFGDGEDQVFLTRIYPLVLVATWTGLIAYVVDSLRSPRVPDQKRKLWAVVLVLGHFFAQPFYWWRYVDVWIYCFGASFKCYQHFGGDKLL